MPTLSARGSLPRVASTIPDGFLTSARLVAALLTSEELRERWDRESPCAGMTLGGLAHHLADQVRVTRVFLSYPPSDEEPIGLHEHFRRCSWVHAPLDAEEHTGLRDEANADAAGGFDALAAMVREDLEELPAAMADAATRTPDAVFFPWEGWTLTTRDLLVSRLVELVVHADDLATGLDLPTPQFPDEVALAVVDALAGIAVVKHGQTEVVRALSRPQRSTGPVPAF